MKFDPFEGIASAWLANLPVTLKFPTVSHEVERVRASPQRDQSGPFGRFPAIGSDAIDTKSGLKIYWKDASDEIESIEVRERPDRGSGVLYRYNPQSEYPGVFCEQFLVFKQEERTIHKSVEISSYLCSGFRLVPTIGLSGDEVVPIYYAGAVLLEGTTLHSRDRDYNDVAGERVFDVD